VPASVLRPSADAYSPDTATADDVKHFQLHLMETGTSICTRNQTMTGVKFLFRVTIRRHDLVAEVFSLREPVKIPLVLSRNEIKRILLKALARLSGCRSATLMGNRRSSASCNPRAARIAM
jgi:site-specific recombinase XerD